MLGVQLKALYQSQHQTQIASEISCPRMYIMTDCFNSVNRGKWFVMEVFLKSLKFGDSMHKFNLIYPN